MTIPCYFFNVHEGSVDFNKNKKIYIFDPFILRIFAERLNISVDKEKIIEGIVGAHLKRSDPLEDIYFTQIKKETDFVSINGDGYEVKYQNKISKEDFKNSRYFKEFTLLSRDTYDKDIMPVHTFLFKIRSG